MSETDPILLPTFSEQYNLIDDAGLVENYGAAAFTGRKYSEVSRPITISWHNLSIRAQKSQKVILDNVSGFAKPGQFIALMGSRLIIVHCFV